MNASWALGRWPWLLLAAGAWWVLRSRSELVRAWEPSELDLRTEAHLPARVGGSGEPTFVVLHGLGATADSFGRGFDELSSHGRVVLPDLLGFGRALDLAADDFALARHLEALDATERTLGSGGSLVVAGHSLGGALALRWAARHASRVTQVVTWGAPLYVDVDGARRRIPGAMQRAVAIDTDLAAWMCARMCAHRGAAAALAVLSSPTTPPALARQAVLHTWPAYRDALGHLVFNAGWIDAVRDLDAAGVPVRLVWGHDDHVGDPAEVESVTAAMANVEVVRVAGGHRYPLVSPGRAVADLLDGASTPAHGT